MNWGSFNDGLDKVNRDIAESRYDPMRMGLVIGDSFISDESIHRGEVLKGEIINESNEKRLDH